MSIRSKKSKVSNDCYVIYISVPNKMYSEEVILATFDVFKGIKFSSDVEYLSVFALAQITKICAEIEKNHADQKREHIRNINS